MNNQELMAAIDKRISCRAYLTDTVEREKLDAIQALVDEANQQLGLNFQIYGPRPDMETALDLQPRMFAGSSPYYVALVADDNPVAGDMVGYYGEKLALLMTHLGLGNCWVAGTYDQKTRRAEVGPGQVVWDVMPFGYAPAKMPLAQRTLRAGLRTRDKKPKDLISADVPMADLPAWFMAGVNAVIKGPSAVNKQPVVFTYANGEVSAATPGQTYAVRFNDLGIAKMHFQVGAASEGVEGTWEWGEGGRFIVA